MEEQIIKPKRIFSFSKYSQVVIFLLLEIFAFVAFSFSNSYLLYSILGLVIVLLLFLVSIKEIKENGFSRTLFYIFPIFAYALITAISNYSKVNTDISVVNKVFIPITLTVFATIGCLTSINKSFKISTVLLVIYSTLCVLTLINFLFTMSRFTPLYTFLYKDYYMYYGGQRSSITMSNIAYSLVGYQFKEVTVGYFSLTPSLLLSSVIMLFFVSPKKETMKFVLYSVFTFVGLISIIFVPSIMTILSSGVIVIALLILILTSKNIIKAKALKIGGIVILVLVLLGIILVFLNAQEWSWLSGYRNMIASNKILNKLFNSNRIIKPINEILANLFTTNKLFGFYYSSIVTEIVATPSNVFIFDNLITSGLFGAVFMLFGIIYGLRGLVLYMKHSTDANKDKYLLFGLIMTYFIYVLFNQDVKYLIFFKSYNFIYFSGPFLVILSLLGYSAHKGYIDYDNFVKLNKKEEKVDEQKA